MTLAYSPSQKSAKLIDEYSVWCPATSSLSASTRSNGVRKVSAIELIRNTTAHREQQRIEAEAVDDAEAVALLRQHDVAEVERARVEHDA